MTQAKRPTTNPLLMQALELAYQLASQRTGNWGVWSILGALLSAYRDGKVGLLARHVQCWQAQRTTSGLLNDDVRVFADEPVILADILSDREAMIV